jgi:hypothetical protein
MLGRALLVLLVGVAIAVAPVLMPLAYGASGDQLWVSRYSGSEHAPDIVSKLVMSPDGSRVFVTGQAYENDIGIGAVTIAYDSATGHELWRSLFHISCCGYNIPEDMVISPDGSRLYIAESSYPTTYNGNLEMLVYDTRTGFLVWKRQIGDGFNQFFGTAIGITPDGRTVFITGGAVPHGGSEDIITIAYDTSTGDRRWTRILAGAGDGDDFVRDLAVSGDGASVFVCGQTEVSSGTYDWLVASYDARTGGPRWQRQIDGPAHSDDFVSAMSASPDGSEIFVVGAFGPGTGTSGAIEALDTSSGSVVWGRSIGGSAGKPGWINAVVPSPDGHIVYTTGYAPGPLVNSEVTTVAYDATAGSTVWGSRFAGPGSFGGVGAGLALGPDGLSLYVAGVVYREGGNEDAVTLAYSAATGDRSWASRYDGPRKWLDSVYQAAVSPDGARVFVSGASKGIDTNYDYATIAYSA